jgi:hypothetical protein
MNERNEGKQVERKGKKKERKKENASSPSVTGISLFIFYVLNAALKLFCNLVINLEYIQQ